MATAVDISCPECEKTLKIPPTLFGKKVKCKHCTHSFVVADPDGDARAKPAKPGAKPAAKAAAAPPPPPAVPARKPFDDDDEGPQKIEVIKEDDTPRCPHCAKDLDPPDAIVCLNCGFNNRTREKAETKKVWAPTAEDWAKHLAPGIGALIVCITLIGVNIWFNQNLREWLVGSVVDMEEKDAAGNARYYIHPGAFRFAIGIISAGIFLPMIKFAYRRLAVNYRPEEKIKK